MQRLRSLVARVAHADAAVLVRGETGTGKELVARAIHAASHRARQPFIAVNCSALPGTLVESMIFGHHRGAFTGADRRIRGQFELAGEGTLLLDEIAEMPVELQAKLLRVLEDKTFRPLGGEAELPLRARVIAATHVDLEERIARGEFRADLFYRLNVVRIDVPPLRRRLEDLDELLATFNGGLRRPVEFTEDALGWLRGRRWDGNVRELKNTIERVSLLCEEPRVDAELLEDLLAPPPSSNRGPSLSSLARRLLNTPTGELPKLEAMERAVVVEAMAAMHGNKSAAARLLGLERKALERRWDKIQGRPRRALTESHVRLRRPVLPGDPTEPGEEGPRDDDHSDREGNGRPL